MDPTPVWEQRVRAPVMTLPTWSRGAPDRCVFATNSSGIWQVHVWDLATGERRQVSDHPVGVREGYPVLDGSEVLFWQEDTGDETGAWLAQPFEGGGVEPFLAGVPRGWNEGITQGPGLVVAGVSTDEGAFEIYVSESGETARLIARSMAWLAVAGLYSAPELAGAVGRRVPARRPARRARAPDAPGARGSSTRGRGPSSRNAATAASAVVAAAWSPVPGDQRLAVTHEPDDRERVAIWDLATGEWRELGVDLPGDQHVVDWFPEGDAVLLAHRFEGRDDLHRVELATGAVTKLDTPPGSIEHARVRPDGAVWFTHTDGVHRTRILDDAGREPVSVDVPAPPGRPFQEWRYRNDADEEVHGWIVEPDGDGPHPVMVFVHGGPHWLYDDHYMPEVQAYVDAGFLVAMPNYRGSTGYGRAWRDALTGSPGFTDVDDVTAGLTRSAATARRRRASARSSPAGPGAATSR